MQVLVWNIMHLVKMQCGSLPLANIIDAGHCAVCALLISLTNLNLSFNVFCCVTYVYYEA